jgi:hypothetical protein
MIQTIDLNLIGNANEIEIDKYKIKFCTFECDFDLLKTNQNFNLAVAKLMGSPTDHYPEFTDIKLDLETLLVAVGLAHTKSDARSLLKKKAFGIGEPGDIKPLTGSYLTIQDPYNSLTTINRRYCDWTFITIEI